MSNTMFLGVIADDFTGASDIAALLARSGAPVSLRLGLAGLEDAQDIKPFEVIALKCRTSPLTDALAETGEALDWLLKNGAKRLFWKYCSTFDSTAEGNIGPVAEQIMARLGTEQTIYCPAFPENGRSIYMGNLFVGDLPLSESPMRDHPLTPMRDSNLTRLLAPQVTRNLGQIRYPAVRDGSDAIGAELKALSQAGVAHVVIDAIDNDNLAEISKAVRDMPLITGGSALALALPNLYRKAGYVDFQVGAASIENTETPSIVLAGSCSAMTQAQVRAFAEKNPAFALDPLALAEGNHALDPIKQWMQALDPDQPKLIYSSAKAKDVRAVQDKLGREKAGKLVEEALSALACFAVETGVRRIVVAGGETSGAVVQALGLTQTSVGPEVAPGVPWLFSETPQGKLAIVLKSGNFGTENFFEDALQSLN